MTREETIRTLKEHKITFQHDFGWNTSTLEAIEMAIKALEQITDLKEAYNKGYKDGQEALAFHLELCKEEGSIIEIPEGATNGQMFCRLFQPYGLKENGSCVWVWFTESNETHYTLPKDWWISPFRKEQE